MGPPSNPATGCSPGPPLWHLASIPPVEDGVLPHFGLRVTTPGVEECGDAEPEHHQAPEGKDTPPPSASSPPFPFVSLAQSLTSNATVASPRRSSVSPASSTRVGREADFQSSFAQRTLPLPGGGDQHVATHAWSTSSAPRVSLGTLAHAGVCRGDLPRSRCPPEPISKHVY